MYIKHLLHLIFLGQYQTWIHISWVIKNIKGGQVDLFYAMELHYSLLKIYLKNQPFYNEYDYPFKLSHQKYEVDPPNLRYNPVSSLSANRQKLLYQSEAWNCRNKRYWIWWDLKRHMTSCPTKFVLNPVSGLSENVRQLPRQSEARHRREISGALLKVD